MRYVIEVVTESKGRPRIGYHNWLTTIRFDFCATDQDPQWLGEAEQRKIVEAITNKDFTMWWSVVEQTTVTREFKNQYNPEVVNEWPVASTWVIRHGYDSGD